MSPRPLANPLAAEAVDSVVADATIVRTAVHADSKNSPRIPSHVRYLVGGFFVLILLIGHLPDFPSSGIERSIPESALLVLVLPNYSPAREALIRLAPALAPLAALAPYDTAVVIQNDPLALHIIAHTPDPEDLLALSQAGLRVTPLGGHIVMIGDQIAAARLQEGPRLPWWIRSRVLWAKKQHAGALLFAPEIDSPWLVGHLEEDSSTLRLTIPLAAASRQTQRALESDVQDTLFNLTQLLLPATLPLKLPDNSVVQELRTETAALSWAIKGENDQTYTLFQNNNPIFSYERLTQSSSCSGTPVQQGVLLSTHHPLPVLKLEISLLKQAIFFCMANVDKL